MHLESNFKRNFPNDNLLSFLRQVEAYGGVVCGGFARWMSGLGPDVSAADVDIYVPNEEVESKVINGLGKYDRFLKNTYGGHYDNFVVENILTLDHKDAVSRFGYPIQIMRVPFKIPEDILKDFDFSICRIYINLNDWTSRYTIDFLEDITERNLRYMKKEIDEHRLWNICNRISKYLLKGFKLDLSEFYRIKSLIKDDIDKDFFIQYFCDMYKRPHLFDYENSAIERLTDVLDIDKIDLIETIGNS